MNENSKACASVGVEPSDTLRRKKLLCRLINEGLESGSISDDDAIFLATPPAAPAVTEPVPYLNERLQDFTCRRAENAGGCEGMTLYFTKLGAHSEYQLYSSEALALWINLGKALGPLAAPAAAVPESPADPLRVACVTLDGSTLTVPVAQLGDVLHGEDDQHTYTLTLKTMTRADFDALGEFNGF